MVVASGVVFNVKLPSLSVVVPEIKDSSRSCNRTLANGNGLFVSSTTVPLILCAMETAMEHKLNTSANNFFLIANKLINVLTINNKFI